MDSVLTPNLASTEKVVSGKPVIMDREWVSLHHGSQYHLHVVLDHDIHDSESDFAATSLILQVADLDEFVVKTSPSLTVSVLLLVNEGFEVDDVEVFIYLRILSILETWFKV